MGIPRGITLIVGGGYHGKSTLLKALEPSHHRRRAAGMSSPTPPPSSSVPRMDVLSKTWISPSSSMIFQTSGIPRHFPPWMPAAVRLRPPEPWRTWRQTAVSFSLTRTPPPLILWSGIRLCSRSSAGKKNPSLRFWRAEISMRKPGISTILVAGSSGAFFHIADTVIQMDCYHPVDITSKVKELCRDYPLSPSSPAPFRMPSAKRIFAWPSKKQRPPGRQNPPALQGCILDWKRRG